MALRKHAYRIPLFEDRETDILFMLQVATLFGQYLVECRTVTKDNVLFLTKKNLSCDVIVNLKRIDRAK